MTAGGTAAEETRPAAGATDGERPGTRDPVISVVVAAYNSRARIHRALDSLREQVVGEPYEVIVVDSGDDDCAAYVSAAYPEARLIRSERRLYPGAARNAGIRAARGRYVAFLPDDCVADRHWLRRRLAKHREGFAAVGGAITNGTPRSLVGSACYYREYSALIPSEPILAEQEVPHCLSLERTLFERLGLYPEDIRTGEDTVFGGRLLATGVEIGFDAGIRIAHRNPTRLRAFLRHQYEHGRGHAYRRTRPEPGLWRPSRAPRDEPRHVALRRMFVTYPARRWRKSLTRIARGQRGAIPGFVLVSPLIWAGLYATAAGQWVEWRSLRESAPGRQVHGSSPRG